VDQKNVVFCVIEGGEGWGAGAGGGGCGALTLAGLIHVTLLGGIVNLDVATDAFRRLAREAFEITPINGIG
jgi:hypothetical protein